MTSTNTPTKHQLRSAVAKTERLPAAPRTLGRVLQLLRHPDSGIHGIAELINRDSGLAAEVLRCANSAYYSRSLRVAAINEAIHVIGFHETIRIVSLVAVRQSTHRNLTSYGIAAEDFWTESLFNGLFLDALVRRVGGIDTGEAYTAGLLRFIGRLAINQALEDLGFGLFWDGHTSLLEWERENVGLTQAEAGAQLLRKWEFPDRVVRAVEVQDAAPADPAEPLAHAMHFATQVLPSGTGFTAIQALVANGPAGSLDHSFAQEHRLTPEAVGDLLREAHAAFVSIRESLYG